MFWEGEVYVAVLATPLTLAAELIVNEEVPMFWIVMVMLAPEPPKDTFATLNWSVFMNVKVNAPIHAATAIDTATVTAMSMMAATTGLSAFLLFNSFLILVCIPPF
jgi:hypothetical protein